MEQNEFVSLIAESPATFRMSGSLLSGDNWCAYPSTGAQRYRHPESHRDSARTSLRFTPLQTDLQAKGLPKLNSMLKQSIDLL